MADNVYSLGLGVQHENPVHLITNGLIEVGRYMKSLLTSLDLGHYDSPDLLWPDSTLFDAAFSLLIGICYALFLLGPLPLDPTNISWLKGDVACHYIGWGALFQTSSWHWPLTFTDHIGFPIGDSVADTDLNSLAALLSKILTPVLPQTFQYFGLWSILSIALQFYFSIRLMRLFFGCRLWPVLCGGLLLTISPVMTWRYLGHFSLSNHWLILAALFLYFSYQRGSLRPGLKLGVAWCALSAAAIAVNPYIAFCVLGVLAAASLRAILTRSFRWQIMIEIGGLSGIVSLCVAYALGLLQLGAGITGAGYKLFSMNLLAPINSHGLALLLPQLPLLEGQQFESYNYLGLGVLALMATLAISGLVQKRQIKLPLPEVMPLLTMSLVYTGLALSSRVTLGSHILFDVDPFDKLTPYLAALRGSGRLFWLPYYLVVFGAVVLLFQMFRKKTAAVLGIAVLIVQFGDEVPLRSRIRNAITPPRVEALRSSVWNHLGEKHSNLFVFPPWQCTQQDTPGGFDGFAIFGILSLQGRLRTNSYYAARASRQSYDWHCDKSIAELVPHLRADSAYVLSPQIAALAMTTDNRIADYCHEVDGFILCSSATDFGLGSGTKVEAPLLSGNSLLFGGNTAVSYLAWGWWATEPWGRWSNGNGILQFRVDSSQAERFDHVLLHLWAPVGRVPNSYAIQNGSATTRGTLPGGTRLRVETLVVKLPLQSEANGTNTLYLKLENPIRPADIGASADSRRLGLGIISLSLVP